MLTLKALFDFSWHFVEPFKDGHISYCHFDTSVYSDYFQWGISTGWYFIFIKQSFQTSCEIF